MFFQRYYLDCLSLASYMIADEQTRKAVVIDPQRDIEIYLEDAKEHGFQIEHVILTHFHADFIAGHIELKKAVGARIYMGRQAEAEFSFQDLAEGDQLILGSVKLSILETPGHTPEGISILVYDLNENPDQPKMILTGDTLFLGDVGRPDLLASIGVTAEELAGMLYHSLNHKILALPDETLVYPAHGAGSMCGKQLSNAAVSTLGEQRKYNYALQPMSKQDFIEMVTTDLPEAPQYFVHDAIMNRKERQTLSETLSASWKAFSLDEVLEMLNTDTQVIDVRDATEFAGAHLKGSINIGLEGRYATWAGSILDKHAPILVIAEDEERIEEAIMRLGRIGFDQVKGFLKDGLNSLKDHPDLVSQTKRISAPAFNELDEKTMIVDIRSQSEWEAGHIEGSVNIPLTQLQERLNEIPFDQTVIVHCQGGYRSSIAISLLEKQKYENVLDLVGGYKAWLMTAVT
ncbi:MAG: MBL fold metallo-hydrolase [Planctomycetes bacterium]|nr:MBL fold metallo-hydrolase [Planctomycetota bacterium]MCH9727175.1 MBL fold metallo-hydrolase [Planctomycetota bacterium]MCH9778568.1 MBL fold metallo-hydrolase [Planctomycetota bacterium]MCH9792549.1 MBL fold metallo-hydrolase [Planctomycetota bacterium]